MSSIWVCYFVVVESPVVLNGHAPPKTVSMLREQQSPPPGSSGYLNNNVVTTTTNLGFREFSESSIIFESGDLSITSIHCDVEAQTENLPLGSSTTAAAAAAPSGITVDTLLRRVLRFPYVEKISLSPPVYSLRRKYLQSALLDWLEGKAHESAGFDLEAAAKRLPRPWVVICSSTSQMSFSSTKELVKIGRHLV